MLYRDEPAPQRKFGVRKEVGVVVPGRPDTHYSTGCIPPSLVRVWRCPKIVVPVGVSVLRVTQKGLRS